MREKILSLLKSRVFEDTLLAIELAYHLPFTDFKQIFDSTIVEVDDRKHVIFKREKEIWLISKFIHNITEWGKKAVSYYESLPDITPENFKE